MKLVETPDVELRIAVIFCATNATTAPSGEIAAASPNWTLNGASDAAAPRSALSRSGSGGGTFW